LLKTVDIRKSIQEDILPIAVNMRDEDVKEIWDSNRYSPYKALVKGIKSRGSAWTIVVNGIPIGMVGVCRGTLLCSKGTIWLLGTDALVEDRKLFLRMSRLVLKNLSKGFSSLENYVSIENKCSLRWLIALGFTIGGDFKSITGVTFRRFSKECI